MQLNGSAGRQVIYVVVAAILGYFGADKASAEQWTEFATYVIGALPLLMAALNVNKGKAVSPIGRSDRTAPAPLPSYQMDSTADEQGGRHRLGGLPTGSLG